MISTRINILIGLQEKKLIIIRTTIFNIMVDRERETILNIQKNMNIQHLPNQSNQNPFITIQ